MKSTVANPLVLPVAAVDRLVRDVLAHGARGVETGAFLLTTVGGPRVTAVARCGDAGIHRYPYQLRVDGDAIERLFDWSVGESLQVRSLVHSHREAAFLSETDRDEGFAVAGFVAGVIPEFAAPPSDVSRWGWWVFQDGDWCGLPPPSLGRHRFRVVTFDRDGVRGD